jgi:hypothetical protein
MTGKWTIRSVRALVGRVLERAGDVNAYQIVDARWLGKWSQPRSGEGPDFRCARVDIHTSGIGSPTFPKFVNVARNGGWEIK